VPSSQTLLHLLLAGGEPIHRIEDLIDAHVIHAELIREARLMPLAGAAELARGAKHPLGDERQDDGTLQRGPGG
jgi:hypothetical protein